MKKRLFNRRGAGIELAILMMVVSFSLAILLTSVALLQSVKKVRAEERMEQSVVLEQLGQDFLSAVSKGDVDGWISNGNYNKAHTETHSWTENIETATCTKEGKKTSICDDCGKTTEEKIPVLDHSYKEEITQASTCEKTGIKTLTCVTCGHSYTESIPKHNLAVDEAQSVLPTCTEGGMTCYYCTIENCAYQEERTIPALGHNYNEKITQAATCTEEGVKTFTCTTCGESHTEEIPPSHTWGDGDKCTLCDETKPFVGKWDDAYHLVVYRNGNDLAVYVTITAKMKDVCNGTPDGENAPEGNNQGAAENQALVIRVEKVTDAEGNFSYKIMEWTKNDRS